MISEVVNAILITYAGTEYLLKSNVHGYRKRNQPFQILLGLVITVNVFERITGAAAITRGFLSGFFHLPKIVLAALSFNVALYYDCRRSQPAQTVRTFLPMVGKAFLRVLPAYPFLAVIFSFGFMILINIFETFHLNLKLLNWPIYYGTLYGPFFFVYYKVKERVIDESLNTLPSRKTPW